MSNNVKLIGPPDDICSDTQELPVLRGDGRRRIYCAGPMFSPAEKWDQLGIGMQLQNANFEIFLPQRDGIELKDLMDLLTDRKLAGAVMMYHPTMKKAVYALDIYMVLGWCDALVFNMNGRVPDDGSIVEAAAAYAAGKPVVLYKQTPVTFIGGDDNPMIDGLAAFVNIDSKAKVPEVVAELIGRYDDSRQQSGWSYVPPPSIMGELMLGSKIWTLRQELAKDWLGNLRIMIPRFLELITVDAPLRVDGDTFVVGEVPIARLSPADRARPVTLPDGSRMTVEEIAMDVWRLYSNDVFGTLHGHPRDQDDPDCTICHPSA
jgi:nucleoside 2-deoxyribosyltransferase